MKNIKNMLISVISLVALFSSQAAVAGAAGLLKSMQGPGLEVYNKSTNAITATLFMNGTFVQKADIAPNQKFTKDIDTKQSMQIGIYDPKTAISTGTFSREITPAPKYFYEINASGKTKYLSWNPTKSTPLYPQTGTFMGLSGKSDSGYPLSDNISQGQIVKK